MKRDDLIENTAHLIRPYRVTDGKKFRLADVDPGDTGSLRSEDRPRAQKALHDGVELLARLQDVLYAQDRWAVLLIFQAMDAAGKDSTIKHVMSGVNPQGCEVVSFKAPSPEELDHDYLWRCQRALPSRGRIGIFNRSYYEEVLVVRVHPELLARQKLPRDRLDRSIWKQRYQDIRGFERYLDRNGILVRKFFLHVSRAEQRRRFLERLEIPSKRWKFSPFDVQERALWKQYMESYEKMIRATATPRAPWFVIPADHKWFARIVVAAAVSDALDSLDLSYPEPDRDQRVATAAAKKALLAEK
jgi:PPK2 family polyphosphate:nucleotide phosphotransferase